MRYLTTPLTILWFLVLVSPGLSQELRCPNLPDVVVTSGDKETVVEICLASKKAIHFLATYNLAPKRPIIFEIIETRIDSSGYKAYGSYDSRTDRIQLMSFDAIFAGAEKPQMYGEPFDRIHYAGAIAHEVTHAIMQHNLHEKPISIGPQEYLAHATQLAVMPAERRAAVIKDMDVAPWESGDIISDVYMAIEPGKFAAKSYQHLISMDEPLPFVDVLLNTKWFYVYVP